MRATRKQTRPGWQQLGSGVAGKWLHHSSGWIVRHCGHPTALWPYYAVSPTGLQLLTENGHGFRTLELAQAAVEFEASKLCECERCGKQLFIFSTGNFRQVEGVTTGICLKCLKPEED